MNTGFHELGNAYSLLSFESNGKINETLAKLTNNHKNYTHNPCCIETFQNTYVKLNYDNTMFSLFV